jgi:acetolactate synthase-1/2/3 large subunit
MTTRAVHRVVADGLHREGPGVVFGLLGDGNLFVLADLVEHHGWRYVSANREDGAVAMADAYARTTDGLGVAALTHGPGLTNAVTPLHEAAKARTPMVVLVGDTPTGERRHNQDIDQRATVEATGAGFIQLRGPGHAAEDIVRAVRAARVERRPIVLNMPTDVQLLPSDEPDSHWPAPSRQAITPDDDVLDDALGVIANANRPLIVAGRGAVTSGARDALLELADVLAAPVATTLKARGFFAGHQFDLGVCGTVSRGPSVETILRSDCLIAFGAGLNRYTLSMDAFAEGRSLVQVDVDLHALGRHRPVTAMVQGDATLTARAMSERLRAVDHRPAGLRSDALAARLASHRPEDDFTDRSGDGTMDPRAACVWLDRSAPEGRSFVVDVGGFMGIPLQYIGVSDPFADVLPANLGSVGLSMAAAVGAGVGRPEHPVVVVTGDGGFMMGGTTEFDTAVREGIDLIVMVLNDGSYGIEYRNLRDAGRDPSLSLMRWAEPARVAEAMGGRGVIVRDPSDLAVAAAAIRDRDRPLVIDVRTDPSHDPYG